MRRVRILVVEDEPKMARLLQRGLSERGDVVEIAATGEEGIVAATLSDFGSEAPLDSVGCEHAEPGQAVGGLPSFIISESPAAEGGRRRR